MPNTERLLRWVERLESGAVVQSQEFLHRRGEPDSFCCVGVACVLAVEDGLELTVVETSLRDLPPRRT